MWVAFAGSSMVTGVGFAVPATMVKRVVDSAVGGAKSVERAWLGVKGDTVSSDMARSLGLDRPQGLMVTDVYAGGPAARAGIEQGDVITAIDGAEVVFVGDSEHDYEIATAVGARCVLFSGGHHSKTHLETLGASVVDDLAEVVAFADV